MPTIENSDAWLSDIDLPAISAMLRGKGVTEIIYKVLPKNANSKNQIYLAPDLSALGKIPSGEVTAHTSISRKDGAKEAVFRAPLDFFWLTRDGKPGLARHAKLIFYPQYPEVRLSGFLKGCAVAPSTLLVKDKRGQDADRILILGVGTGRQIFALILPPESPAAKEICATAPHDAYGALNIIPLQTDDEGNGFHELMRELCLIHRKLWVPASRLDGDGNRIACRGSNCNGNTLEALLGIRSNGFSLPDFKGWELKSRLVGDADRPGSSVVTLFTPQPAAGAYRDLGTEGFVRKYGYPDVLGREDRWNFGGIHRAQKPAHPRTGLRLVLEGFDPNSGKYLSTGSVQLVDAAGAVAAEWPFAKLLDHWKTKHAYAAFVPAEQRKLPGHEYRYGRNILLGEGADFKLLLEAIYLGKVYYDPGIKVLGFSTAKPTVKARSQFRVASKDLASLYVTSRIVDACEEAEHYFQVQR